MAEIKVTVVKFPDRDNLMLRYIDPMSGKQKHKSAGTTNRKEAVKAAGKWEAELREGRYAAPSRLSWAEFRQRHEDEVQPAMADETGRVLFSVFNRVEEILGPQRLADLTADRLSYFQARLREPDVAAIRKAQEALEDAREALAQAQGDGRSTVLCERRIVKVEARLARAKTKRRSQATIRTYLAHLQASLKWAVDVGMLPALPKVKMPARAKGQKVMKGRPITLEEFERMLDKVPTIVGASAAVGWAYYLNGLWTSGLRLAESLRLWWDRDDRLCVDLSGTHPMLRIPAALEKGNQTRVLPMAPEFAELLLLTPEHDRAGRVFKFTDRSGSPRVFRSDWVGNVVAEIGEAAGVVVNTDHNGHVKFASAHDLRRSFGERWAVRVMPQVLKELMRHESIDTTMRYYVGRNAQTTAAVLWEAHRALPGNRSSNSSGLTTVNQRGKPAATGGCDGL